MIRQNVERFVVWFDRILAPVSETWGCVISVCLILLLWLCYCASMKIISKADSVVLEGRAACQRFLGGLLGILALVLLAPLAAIVRQVTIGH